MSRIGYKSPTFCQAVQVVKMMIRGVKQIDVFKMYGIPERKGLQIRWVSECIRMYNAKNRFVNPYIDSSTKNFYDLRSEEQMLIEGVDIPTYTIEDIYEDAKSCNIDI